MLATIPCPWALLASHPVAYSRFVSPITLAERIRSRSADLTGPDSSPAAQAALVWRAGLVVVGCFALFRAWVLSQSWFSFDDLFFVAFGRNTDTPSWDYLSTVYAGHVMPGGHLASWVIGHFTAPFTFWPFALVLWVMQVAAAYGMLRLVLSLFGHRWAALIPLLAYTSWIITLPAASWWAAGINQLPLQLALVFGVHSWVAYLRTRRVRPVLVTVLWLVFALCFYEKSVLLYGIAGLVTLCWFTTGSLLQRIVQLWTRYRVGLVALTAVTGAYLALYVTYALAFDPGSRGEAGPLAFKLVGEALVPAAFGGPLTFETVGTSELADAPQVFILLTWVAAGALVVHAARTRTRSRRAWLLLVAPVLVNLQLLLSARAVVVGSVIGLEFRYQTEMAVLMALAGALAFLPVLGAPEQNTVRPEAEALVRRVEQPRVVAAATAVVVALGLFSSVHFARNWHDHNLTPGFFERVESTVAASPVQPVPLINTPLPNEIMWAMEYPEDGFRDSYPKNSYRYVMSELKGVTYPSTALDAMYTFDSTGALAYAGIEPLRTAEPVASCGVPVTGTTTQVELDGPMIRGDWWIRMHYYSPVDFEAELTAGETTRTLRFPAGLRNLFVQVYGEFDSFTLTRTDSDSTIEDTSTDEPGTQDTDTGDTGSRDTDSRHDEPSKKKPICLNQVEVGGPVAGLPVAEK